VAALVAVGLVLMSALSAITQGRQSAEAGMLDDCRITRGGGATTIDPATGLPVTTSPTTVYGGTGDHTQDRCKLQTTDLKPSYESSGEHAYTLTRMELHIPVGAGPVKPGDDVEITASALDARNVGRKFRISAGFSKTYATAQRLPVEEVIG
jgi:hypothetical protein